MLSFFPENSGEKPVLVMTDEDERDCAWCMQEAGQDLGNGSHGICAEHSGRLLKQYKSDKAKRKGGQA